MTSTTSRLALCAAVGAALAVPGAAQAATKTVQMGTPPSAAKTLQKSGVDVNAFFPSSITIRVRDSVRFVPVGFHDVHFTGRSGKPTTPFVPTGKTIAGVNDELGVPFWFNGQPEIGANPKVFTPRGNLGKTVVTDGTKEIYSGAPITNRPKPMVVRFTKSGLFRYVCDIHPGMIGSVRVVRRSSRVPSARADARRVSQQISRAKAAARRFKDVEVPANTVNAGMGGAGGVSLLAFVPSKLTVPVNTTVTFRMMSGDFETHTATTGPGDPLKEPNSFIGKLSGSLEGPAPDQRGLYPSDLPPAAALTPALHGNGFWNSGAMDAVGASPLAKQTQVRFAAAGTYRFVCLIHPFMQATITAQ